MAKKKRKRKKKVKFNMTKPIKWMFLMLGSILSMIVGCSFKTIENSIKDNNFLPKSISVEKIVENVEKIQKIENIEEIKKIIPISKEEYKVLYVSDGDTIAVKKIENELTSGSLMKIRLFGIDAPETKQDYGYESKIALMSMIKDKNINLEIKNKDKYGRFVSIVYYNGKNINEEMVKGGHAWWYKQYDKNNETLKKYEEEAKREKKGIFSKKGYVEPWNFRKKKK